MPSERLQKAINLATSAHKGQTDRGGKDYIEHPKRVAAAVAHLGEDYEIVGWLHDVVEDTPVTITDIRIEFGHTIGDAVESVTRIEKPVQETYRRFIERSKQNVIGRQVKIADVKDNMLPERVACLPVDQQGVVNRYRKALAQLNAEEKA